MSAQLGKLTFGFMPWLTRLVKTSVRARRILVIALLVLSALISLMLSLSLVSNGKFIWLYGLTDSSLRARNSVLLSTVAFLLAGIALPLSGTVMQFTTRNLLASPFTLGVVSASGLGQVIGRYVLRLTDAYYLFGFMLVFSLTVGLAMLWLNSRRTLPPTQTLVIGILSGALLTLISYIIQYARNNAPIVFDWVTSGAASYTWSVFYAALPLVCVSGLLVLLGHRALSVYFTSPQRALTLGVWVKSMRLVMHALVIIIATSVTLLVGPLAFVGLVPAACARLWMRSNNFLLLAFCAMLGGATLLLLSNALSTVSGGVAPHLFAVVLGAPLLGLIVWKGLRE